MVERECYILDVIGSSPIACTRKYAPVAQLDLERVVSTHSVAGSSPARSTKAPIV